MSELYYAEMEASRNEAEEAYFRARPNQDASVFRAYFRAGFERGFQKLWNERPAEQQSAAQGGCPHTFKAVSPRGTVCCACGERLSGSQGERRPTSS